MCFLRDLGLFNGDIEHASNMCYELLENLVISRKFSLDELVLERLKVCSDFWEGNPTNTIITFMFEETVKKVSEKYPKLEISFTVNGYASDIFIKDINIYNLVDKLLEMEIPDNTISRILSSRLYETLSNDYIVELADYDRDCDGVLSNIIDGVCNDENLYLYDSVEDLGNASRDEYTNSFNPEATDEELGKALLQIYADDNSNTVYHRMSDGSVIEIRYLDI